MFSDDAYNKEVKADAAGTLVGNWFEERCLREAIGEGRTVPQRHNPRSKMTEDGSQTANGIKRVDNTFERVTGPKVNVSCHEPSSTVIGRHDQETVNHLGPRKENMRRRWQEAAELEVQHEEAILAQQDQERSFLTTHGVTFRKPDESLSERAQHLRKSCQQEIQHGPLPERTLALNNEGLDFDSHTHYSNVEGVSAHRVAMADPALRSDMKVTACTGVRAFGKHSDFSKPISEFSRGLGKDEELASMYHGLQGTQPLRTLGGGEPRAGAFVGVPSLTALKTIIHSRIAEVWGAHGYVLLRQRLFDHGDQEGFCEKSTVAAVLREQLGLTEAEVPSDMLDTYLNQLVTMKKTELKIGSFMSSLRPVLAQRDRRQVLEAFKSMEHGGSLRLGDWLSRLREGELRSTIVAAFGAQEEEHVADMPLSEQVFLEVLSDLAPFSSVEALLA